jgi:threonine/homoserine/homoserine lactone efflux protein
VSTLRATKLGALSGIQCAVGHTIVEAPLVLGLSLGLAILLNPALLRFIAVVGGCVLVIFAVLQFLRASRKVVVNSTGLPAYWEGRPGVILGIVFTGLNPFFIIWWLTVGSTLISRAILLGAFGGVAMMYAAHIWMDYAWLGGTATIASHGRFVLGKWFRLLLVVFGGAMAYFGIVFILSAF